MASLSHRERGNALYTSSQFREAAATYSEGIECTNAKSSELALLLSNRAACWLKLDEHQNAADDCRRALALEPCAWKAHMRLAQALHGLHGKTPESTMHHDCHAGPAACAAIALLQGSAVPDALLSLYHAVRRAADAGDGAAFRTPTDPSSITLVSSASELGMALSTSRGVSTVVLKPGTYSMDNPMQAMQINSGGCSLIGLGTVLLQSRASHAVYVQSSSTQLYNIQLEGSGRQAAACVAGGRSSTSQQQPRLVMVKCVVQRYGDVAVLAVGAQAVLVDCVFSSTQKQAVEIREGASLIAHSVTIQDCGQGFSLYGGAKAGILNDCTITGCHKEGVLVAGSHENAATRAQRVPQWSQRGNAASQRADEWGKAQGAALQVTISGCTIANCGNFGISADSGAHVVVTRCALEHNDPHSLLIKGCTDAIVTASHFTFSGEPSKSLWAQLNKAELASSGLSKAQLAAMGLSKVAHMKQSGIEIGINYEGAVTVWGNAFIGPEGLGLQQDCDKPSYSLTAARKTGMYSRPATTGGNLHFESSASAAAAPVPTVEALAQLLPSHLAGDTKARQGGRRERRVAPPLSALARPTSTFQQSAWAPTAHEYYAIGNTFGQDMTGGAALDAPQPLRVLLAACGDIRNMLATVQGIVSRSSSDATAAAARAAGGAAAGTDPDPASAIPSMHFVLNDGNLSMLARNAVMLHMAIEQRAPAEALLDVWASHTLSSEHVALLQRSITTLATQPWPAWLRAAASLDEQPATPQQEEEQEAGAESLDQAASQPSSEAQAAATASPETLLRQALTAWSECTLTTQQLLALRSQAMGGGASSASSVAMSLDAIRATAGTGAVSSKKAEREVAEYVQSGSLRPGQVVNPTFLLAPQLQYTTYFSSSIFRALPLGPAGSSNASAATTLYNRLVAALRPQLGALQAAASSGALRVVLVPGDILCALITPPPPPPPSRSESGTGTFSSSTTTTTPGSAAPNKDMGHGSLQAAQASPAVVFDFIDCSNVADYVSLPALVQAAAPRLARAPHARLTCESFLAYGYARKQQGSGQLSPAGFVASQVGLSLSTYEELLGVRLVGGQPLAGREASTRLTWVPKLPHPGTATTQASAAAATAAVGALSLSSAGGASDSGEGSVTSDGSSSSSFLTPGFLMLELLAACKKQVSPYASAGSAAVPPNGHGDWGSAAAPATLTHLVSLAAPQHTEQLLRTLIACDASGAAQLFKWELVMHANTQSSSGTPLTRLTYTTDPGYRLAPYPTNPLLLAFSQSPLPLGPVPPGAAKQLLASFAWDEDQAAAHFLLPTSILDQCTGWHVTLCVVVDERGAEAVAPSVRLGSLPAQPVPAPGGGSVSGWLRLQQQPGLEHLGDLSLLSQAASRAKSKSSGDGAGAGAWQATVHSYGGGRQGGDGGRQGATGGITVDVLAPAALPAPEDADLSLMAEAGQVVVRVQLKARASAGKGARSKTGGSGGSGGGGGAAWPHPLEFRVQVPAAVAIPDGLPSVTKVSRKLGVMSARFETPAASSARGK